MVGLEQRIACNFQWALSSSFLSLSSSYSTLLSFPLRNPFGLILLFNIYFYPCVWIHHSCILFPLFGSPRELELRSFSLNFGHTISPEIDRTSSNIMTVFYSLRYSKCVVLLYFRIHRGYLIISTTPEPNLFPYNRTPFHSCSSCLRTCLTV